MKSARRIRYHGVAVELFELGGEAAHKILHVLRLAAGDKLSVVDDSGQAFCCVIEGATPHAVTVRREGPDATPAPLTPLHVALGVIKGNRMDWAIEKLAEIGVAEITPIICSRSLSPEIGREKRERWNKIAESAAMQSGRAGQTRVQEPVKGIAPLLTAQTPAFFLDHLEEESDALSIPAHALLFIGPEGGWTKEERALLRVHARGISLGSGIFRSETAAILGAFFLAQHISTE